MVFPLPKTLFQTLAKNLVKNLAKNLVGNFFVSVRYNSSRLGTYEQMYIKYKDQCEHTRNIQAMHMISQHV